MDELNFPAMHALQEELHQRYADKWRPLSPQIARDKILWMMIEAGEMADVIKKKGDDAILQDPATRAHFIEEMCDTLMYFNDVMLCYQITPEEFEQAYLAKHRKNMTRW